MSYYGWNGHDDLEASKRFTSALIALRHAGNDENLFIDMNDSGFTYDEIADYLDRS